MDLKGEAAKFKRSNISAAIAADVKRFCHQINTDEVLGTHRGRTGNGNSALRMRFGIGMNTNHTLEEVGQQFSVTRERIRQIDAKALRKLKHPSRSRVLRSYLDN